MKHRIILLDQIQTPEEERQITNRLKKIDHVLDVSVNLIEQTALISTAFSLDDRSVTNALGSIGHHVVDII